MTGQWIVVLAVAAVASFALLLSVRLLRVVKKLQEQVRNLQNISAKGQIEAPAPVNFSTHLGAAERKVSAVQRQTGGATAADKYRQVASLAGQGLEPAAIADALQLSPVEVEQLMSLARLRPQERPLANEVTGT